MGVDSGASRLVVFLASWACGGIGAIACSGRYAPEIAPDDRADSSESARSDATTPGHEAGGEGSVLTDSAIDATESGVRDATSDSSSDTGDGAAADASDGSVSDGHWQDGGGDSSGDGAGPGDGGACNNLRNKAPLVAAFAIPAAPPAMSGGTLVPGTYFVTQVLEYTGPGGASGPTGVKLRETIELSPTTTSFVLAEETVDAGPGAEERGFGTYVTSGDTLTVTLTCGPTGVVVEGYTAGSSDAGLTTIELLLSNATHVTLERQ